jgi:hypothetical protein
MQTHVHTHVYTHTQAPNRASLQLLYEEEDTCTCHMRRRIPAAG